MLPEVPLTRRRFLYLAAVAAPLLPLAARAAAQTTTEAGGAAAPVRPPGATDPDPRARPVIPQGEIRLFNGRDFSGLYTFLPSKKVNNDPDGIFTVQEGGVIKVTGKEFGYFATAVPYAYYHLSFDVRWGEQKWPPRDKPTTPRDSGVLVHVFGDDKVWPNSFECQIQENDFGDIFHIGGFSSVVDGKRQNGRVVRKKANEKPHGQWNTVEVVCRGDAVTNIVNGMVEAEATSLTRRRDGEGGALNFGRIAFQSEGAEVYYRNIVARPLR
jgi:hypothetical protein